VHLPFELDTSCPPYIEVVMKTTLNNHSKHSRFVDEKATDDMEMKIIGDEVTMQPCRLRVCERVLVDL
jgi:hypothetical protein